MFTPEEMEALMEIQRAPRNPYLDTADPPDPSWRWPQPRTLSVNEVIERWAEVMFDGSRGEKKP
jgi:hypothetical protein